MAKQIYSDAAIKKFRLLRQRGRIAKEYNPAFFDAGINERRKKERGAKHENGN